MTSPENRVSVTKDVWLEHEHGRLFVRTWTPAGSLDVSCFDTPIVLFHDSLGCVALWRDFPEQLSRASGRRVIAYDRLGFGQSGSRCDTLAMDFISDEAKTYFPFIREQLGFQQFICCGHSVGGGMAVSCAAEFPADCTALITIAAQAFTEEQTLHGIQIAQEQFKDEAQIERLKKYHGEKARWVLDAWIQTWLHPSFASWSLQNVLSGVISPALLIHGANDEYGSIRHPNLIAQWSSGVSRVEIIPDTFHVPHKERPELMLNLLAGFITTDLSSVAAPVA